MAKKISIMFVCMILILGLMPIAGVSADDPISVKYRTHVQDVGWQGFVYDGAMSGTSGQSKRLEGIEIIVTGNSNLGIQYSTHVQDIGWQGFVSDGAMSGTSGQSKRLEAIKIQLTGTDAALYDVYYRVHAQDYGWLGWAMDGKESGTQGLSKRLEAIEIRIVSAGSPAPAVQTEVLSFMFRSRPYPIRPMFKITGGRTMYQTELQAELPGSPNAWRVYVSILAICRPPVVLRTERKYRITVGWLGCQTAR